MNVGPYEIPDDVEDALRAICRDGIPDFPQVPLDPPDEDRPKAMMDDPDVDPIELRFSEYVESECDAARITQCREDVADAKEDGDDDALASALLAEDQARDLKQAHAHKRTS